MKPMLVSAKILPYIVKGFYANTKSHKLHISCFLVRVS